MGAVGQAVSESLFVLTGAYTRNGVEFVSGDMVLVDAVVAARLLANRGGLPVLNPTPLQLAEARHLALARRQSCCFGR